MNAEAIRQLLKAQPFEPFRIYLSNGDSFDVKHPEQAWVLSSRMMYGDPATDKYTIISLVRVNAIKMLTAGEPVKN